MASLVIQSKCCKIEENVVVEGDLAFTLFTHTQPAFTRHLIIETLEQGVEYVRG